MNETRGLWRGKRVDNGEWVQGSYVMDALTQEYGVEMDGFIRRFNPQKHKSEMFEVDGETLGECTGLRDKNGKLIFEGDIIKTKEYGKDVGHSNINDYDIFVVKYEPATFRLENNNRMFILDDDKYSKYEIIGNIHDNSELLKDVKRRKGR